jgi:hypothetical protein
MCKLPEPSYHFEIGTEIEAEVYSTASEAYLGVRLGNGMVAVPDVDETQVDARWYDASGSESRTASDQSAWPFPYYQLYKDFTPDVHGTCGYGEAVQGSNIAEPTTTAWSAPSECPSDPGS